MKKHYIVYYFGESFDYYEKKIFVTDSESKAKKYRARFNRILKKWKLYYSQFEEPFFEFTHIADKHLDKSDRWHALGQIERCEYTEIEFR